jgi:hypothetical protein
MLRAEFENISPPSRAVMATPETPHIPRSSVPPPTVASAGTLPPRSARASAASAPGVVAGVRVGEDGFASEATVDAWVRSGAASRGGASLALPDGRRFVLRDAIRVLGRRNGDTDPYGFTGRVESIRDFIRRGANVSADALRLGPAVYDIEYGYVVVADGARG